MICLLQALILHDARGVHLQCKAFMFQPLGIHMQWWDVLQTDHAYL